MGFLQHYYVEVSADHSDPPRMHPHAAELSGIAVSEKAISEHCAPLQGVPGGVSFSQRSDSWRALRRSPQRQPGRAWGNQRRSFPTEQETAPYETVCERPTARELPRVYTSVESTAVADGDSRHDDEHRFGWAS